MKRIGFPVWVVLTAFVLTCLFALAARAQEETCPAHPACGAAPPTAGLCRIYLNAPNGNPAFLSNGTLGTSHNGIPRIQPSGCYDPNATYAMAGWRFNIRGGAKIQQMTFLQQSDGLQFAFTDKDGGEYADGFVWLYKLPEGTRLRTVNRISCRTSCDMSLGQFRGSPIFLIAGYDFLRHDGDGHVRRIGLRQNSGFADYKTYVATFTDDDFLFDVTVQYAIIPDDGRFIRHNARWRYEPSWRNYDDRRARDLNFVHPQLDLYTETPLRGLNAFAFDFGDGGRFLEYIGIEPFDDYAEVWFQDHQSDEDLRFPDDRFEGYWSYIRLP
ncbi:hypothetical protein [Roseovarius sp. 2305UL8-3]|uniref:hypothetical protein n=1 Tax=Roseovarius conchicola TaxID=3121636 RepID=UPI003528C387